MIILNNVVRSLETVIRKMAQAEKKRIGRTCKTIQ